jgi:enoyl-CoA hydratase
MRPALVKIVVQSRIDDVSLISMTRPDSDNGSADFTLRQAQGILVLTLVSGDGTNRLSLRSVSALKEKIQGFVTPEASLPLIIAGDPLFSAGADLKEISQLSAADALIFARMGQELMHLIECYPAPVCAAIHGYCMGGGLDLALACQRRIASPRAVFGHRGAALGLLTGWGGTQRLPRLIGKGRTLEMLVAAQKLHATDALRIGLIEAIAEDPVAEAVRRLAAGTHRGEAEIPGSGNTGS